MLEVGSLELANDCDGVRSSIDLLIVMCERKVWHEPSDTDDECDESFKG